MTYLKKSAWIPIRLILFIMIISLVACGRQETENQTAVETPPPAETDSATEPTGPKGTLTVALTTTPNSLDMAIASERNSQNASSQLFDTLIWVDDDGRKMPALAERWEISPNGREYTFYLRQNVTFHNGEPLNADAVIFSWERGSRPEMRWSDRWQRAEAVEKIDDYTIKARTAQPDPLFLSIVAEQWGIVPPGYIAEVGEDGFAAHPVGAGPFTFVSWENDRITLRANPNYWDEGQPKVETLIFRPMPDMADRVAAIQAGEIDIATRLDMDEAQRLQGLLDIHVVRYPVDRAYYIAFNNLTTGIDQPTIDPRVRLAMNYAVNRQAMIDQLFNGFARLSTGLITPANLGYDYTLEPFAYDPEKARDLLTEAGYPDGFTIAFACPTAAYASFEEVCAAIQNDLAQVGIVADLQLIESGDYWDLEAEKALPPLFGDSWSERSGEALPRLKGALGGWDASFSAWSDAAIDALLDQISVTVDDEKRAAFYIALQKQMREDPPFIYLYEPVTFEAVNARVQNYKPRAAENYYLKDVWILDE